MVFSLPVGAGREGSTESGSACQLLVIVSTLAESSSGGEAGESSADREHERLENLEEGGVVRGLCLRLVDEEEAVEDGDDGESEDAGESEDEDGSGASFDLIRC